MSARYWLLIILLGVIWGGSFPLNAILNRELDPLWISAGRVVIGALGSWTIVMFLRKKLPPFSSIYLHFLVLGTMSYAVPFALFPLSQHALPAGAAAIINAMMPIMTVVVSHFWPGGEQATLNKSIGVVAGFVGVAIMASPALSHGMSAEVWAVLACLLATLCYAVALNYTRSFLHIDPAVLGACALTGASISAVIAAFLVHGTPAMPSIQGWGALLAIGLVATGIAFQIMYRVLPIVGATNFSITTFIAPVSAIILSVSFLGETIQPIHFLGMAGIFLGLLLIDGRVLKRLRRRAA
ncbi:MAG: DMT family transporter [Hyphomicrobiaceae bacterium]|nr:DMT family transporter [Hyphomicrobiaceae bacterium]MCC0023587.1 DMT family transporter [Hyphomicrobiaceae bacterium]